MLQYEAKKEKKAGAKWITARSNHSSWSIPPAGGIFWSSETMWGTGNTVFYSEWDKALISDRMKQGTIKLDTKMHFFVPVYLYICYICSTCVLIVCMSCVWKLMCSHYSLGLLLVSAVLYHMSSHELYNMLYTHFSINTFFFAQWQIFDHAKYI